MATGKRYYWMKLKESFMTSDTIDYFMSLPNGANYVVLYQMLCLKTINTEGRFERKIGAVFVLGLINAKSSAVSEKWRRSSARSEGCPMKNAKSVCSDGPNVKRENLKRESTSSNNFLPLAAFSKS